MLACLSELSADSGPAPAAPTRRETRRDADVESAEVVSELRGLLAQVQHAVVGRPAISPPAPAVAIQRQRSRSSSGGGARDGARGGGHGHGGNHRRGLGQSGRKLSWEQKLSQLTSEMEGGFDDERLDESLLGFD